MRNNIPWDMARDICHRMRPHLVDDIELRMAWRDRSHRKGNLIPVFQKMCMFCSISVGPSYSLAGLTCTCVFRGLFRDPSLLDHQTAARPVKQVVALAGGRGGSAGRRYQT
eukprot:6213474-Pleurochrysis_carterae.AAC.4